MKNSMPRIVPSRCRLNYLERNSRSSSYDYKDVFFKVVKWWRKRNWIQSRGNYHIFDCNEKILSDFENTAVTTTLAELEWPKVAETSVTYFWWVLDCFVRKTQFWTKDVRVKDERAFNIRTSNYNPVVFASAGVIITRQNKISLIFQGAQWDHRNSIYLLFVFETNRKVATREFVVIIAKLIITRFSHCLVLVDLLQKIYGKFMVYKQKRVIISCSLKLQDRELIPTSKQIKLIKRCFRWWLKFQDEF